MKVIRIHKIKHIEDLEFELPGRGVYVLAGGNGSGKTTLLACIYRIGSSRAFRDYFKPSRLNQMDHFGHGHIAYEIDGSEVKYKHSNVNWTPRPKSRSVVLGQFGYPQVRFLPATGNRLFISDSEFRPSKVRQAETWLKQDLNHLLETTKFENLRYIQTGSTRGPGSGSQRWKRAFVVRINPNNTPAKFYSEKNFSLGEILVLNTLILIQDVPDQSLLLIDELEMALHPRLQVRLLRYLEQKAIQKNLTVILSTHSSSLIKSISPTNLIYLENPGNGQIIVHRNIYPTVILQNVAVDEDQKPDYVFYVEDEMAEALLKQMIIKYWKLRIDRQPALCKVLPIGGYKEVINFTLKSKQYLMPQSVGQYAFLDHDVEGSYNSLQTKGNSRTSSEQKWYEKFNALGSSKMFLPITPELGIWNWANNDPVLAQGEVNKSLIDAPINLNDLLTQVHVNVAPIPGKSRQEAKNRMKWIVEQISISTNRDPKQVIEILFGSYVQDFYNNPVNIGALQSMFGPIFNRRGN